ncbi:hypothetical protein K492DRAFT_194397 [Lichtheimia hyalospora FSU 10163]|nr:hypothetical protein K492DRAFT_194397 [Lichtheimia hyalospora FSU 10163]
MLACSNIALLDSDHPAPSADSLMVVPAKRAADNDHGQVVEKRATHCVAKVGEASEADLAEVMDADTITLTMEKQLDSDEILPSTAVSLAVSLIVDTTKAPSTPKIQEALTHDQWQKAKAVAEQGDIPELPVKVEKLFEKTVKIKVYKCSLWNGQVMIIARYCELEH